MLKRRSGMTLFELLIVLALMAGLAGMALTTVGDMGARGRYDETTARLLLIREAVVGDGVAPSRFLRDMGRLPYLYSTIEGEELVELWKNDVPALDYGAIGPQNITWPDSPLPAGFPDGAQNVTLRGGWNGPYLQVNDPSDARVFDGFGNPFNVTTDVSYFIQTVTSPGADGASGGSDWPEIDRTLDFANLTASNTSLTVSVRVRDSGVWVPVDINASGTADNQVDALRIGFFYPHVTASGKSVVASIKVDNQTCNYTYADLAGVDKLMPVTVCVFAYATDTTPTPRTLISGIEPECVDLDFGRNSITLYVREP